MGCGGSKSTRVKATIGGRHKALTALLKSAEKLRDTVTPAADAVLGNLDALKAWGSEEDCQAIRESGGTLHCVTAPIVASTSTLRTDAEAFVQTFSQIMGLENDLDLAERESAKVQKQGEKCDEKLLRIKRRDGDTMQAHIDAVTATEATKTANASLESKRNARDVGRNDKFNKGIQDLAAALIRHYTELSTTFETVLLLANEIPEVIDEAEATREPRPKGQPSIIAQDYGNLKAAVKSWDQFAKAEAEYGKAMRILLRRVGQWGNETGGAFVPRCAKVNDAAEAWEHAIAPFVASLASACASFAEIEDFEKQIDAKWRPIEDAERALQKALKRQAIAKADDSVSVETEAGIQTSVDEATAEKYIAMDNIRSEQAAVTALKLTNFRTTTINTSESRIKVGKTVTAIFTEIATTLESMTQATSPPCEADSALSNLPVTAPPPSSETIITT